MRALLATFCISLFLCASARGQSRVAPPEGSRVEGLVRAADTGEPLRRARVFLRRTERGAPQFEAVTAADGVFVFSDLPAGDYRLRVERHGYITQEYGQRIPGSSGRTLNIAAGQRLGNLLFRLLRAGIVAGRVVDEEGEPLPGVEVFLLRVNYVRGQREIAPAGTARTNDLGEYRLAGIAPGRYLIGAGYAMNRIWQAGSEVSAARRSSGMEDDAYGSVFYPGTPDIGQARVLEVAAGQTLSAVNLDLLATPPMFVRGRVTSESTGQPARGAQIWVLPRSFSSQGPFTRSQTRANNETGVFEARVPFLGSYVVQASVESGGTMYFGRQNIEVRGSDVEGIELLVGPTLELSGGLRVEGSDRHPAGINLSLRLREPGPSFGGERARVNDDGSFKFSNVIENEYFVVASGLPEDFYLKSARLNEEDVLESGLTLSRGHSRTSLELVVSPLGGRVDGLVLNEEGLPVAGTVVLAPPANRRQRSFLFKVAAVDELGRFSLRGVPPGDYKLFACEETEDGICQDPEFLASKEALGVSVKVSEGSTQSVEVKAIPAASPKT